MIKVSGTDEVVDLSKTATGRIKQVVFIKSPELVNVVKRVNESKK